MPAYTHLQRAEPVLVAPLAVAYVEMFLRDADRLGGLPQAAERLPARIRGGRRSHACRWTVP